MLRQIISGKTLLRLPKRSGVPGRSSDNEASRQVAFKMMQHYFKNDAFVKDFNAAVAEWKEILT